jgi:hypothetical protein
VVVEVVVVAGAGVLEVLLVVAVDVVVGAAVVDVANWNVTEGTVVEDELEAAVNATELDVEDFGCGLSPIAAKAAMPSIATTTMVAPSVVLFISQWLHRSKLQYSSPSPTQNYLLTLVFRSIQTFGLQPVQPTMATKTRKRRKRFQRPGYLPRLLGLKR